MSELFVRCFKCKGKGFTRRKVELFPAVFTLGLTALIEKSYTYECDACDGKGYLK